MIDISIAAKDYRLGYLKLYEAARLAGVMPEQILDYLGELAPTPTMRDGRIDQLVVALAVRTKGVFI